MLSHTLKIFSYPRAIGGLHVGRRAGARSVRAGCAPRTRAREVGRPVRPFSSRSGLLELRGRAAGERRHALRGPQVRRAFPAHLRSLARRVISRGGEKFRRALQFAFSKAEIKRSADHKEDAIFPESGARVQEPIAVTSS